MAVQLRLLAALAALILLAAACSSGPDVPTAAEPAIPQTSTAIPFEERTTTTTGPTPEERARTQAEIAQLVTDYWLVEKDTSEGELGVEYLTGQMALLMESAIENFQAVGQILRGHGQSRIEILEVEVDFEAGRGKVTSCGESGSELVDAETFERVDQAFEQFGEPTAPRAPWLNVHEVELTPEGWRIYEYYLAGNTDIPIPCEIDETSTTTATTTAVSRKAQL